jgi:hypothetical protein
MLEAVDGEGLVRTQQDGLGLEGDVMICELWRFVVEL